MLRLFLYTDEFYSNEHFFVIYERAHLQETIGANSFDESAFAVLLSLLQRYTKSST